MRRHIANWFPVIIIFLVIVCTRYDEKLYAAGTSNNYSLTTEFPQSKGPTLFKCNSTTESVFHCDEENCIPEKNRCNGIPECDNGEDELVRHCGCLPNEFRCTNSCIDILKRCDRKFDCANGEDEQNCVAHICPITHFKCANHFCIPEDSHCNFRDDCGDNSDELNCQHRECWHGETKCKNGQCLRPGYLCDTIKDCEDNSDELECDEEHFVECGDGTRIHKKFWCDGMPQCPDNHADELNCSRSEPCQGEDKFQCSNGRCIRKANVCDAHCDCVPTHTNELNGTLTRICDDERDCDEFYSVYNGVKLCRVGVTLTCFHDKDLQRKADRCIRREFICDGVNDCHIGNKGLDEFGCINTTEGQRNPPSSADGFLCHDGRLFPNEVKCDFKVDCMDGEDERDCDHTHDPQDCEATCRSGQCIPKRYLCDRKFQCMDKSDEMDCHENICPEGWKHCITGGQCIQENKWCDFYVDCLDGLDEAECVLRDCLENEFKCRNGQCINVTERCLHNTQLGSGCADGSHLLNCAEWTCPEGFYKCRRGPCINETLKCDNKPDCKQTWDDEDNCTILCTHRNCECQDIHINCSSHFLVDFPDDIEKEYTKFHFSENQLNNLTISTFVKLRRIIFLDLSNNNITALEPMIFQPLWMLGTLNLQNNRIRKLENSTFFGLSSLTGLHLQNNSIEHLCKMAFYGLLSLTTLSLRRQRISIIEEEAFVGLRSLLYLDLSGNEITSLDDGTFIGMPKLLHLDLSNNRLHLSVIQENVFRVTFALEELITDEFRFCCLARHVPSCKPLPDEFSSCEDLMTNLILRICVWVLGIVATFANLLVFAFRSLYHNSNKVHTFLIKNLALGDFLMGTYLLIIGFVDWQYRGMYFKYESQWRSSYMCNFAGFISTFSSELSVFTLTVITLDRFLVIIFPFRMQRLEMNRTRFLMFLGWILAAIISVIPLPFFRIDYFRNFYGRSGVCLPLHITPDKPSGWEYSVFVFLFLNFLSFAVIAGSYLWMYWEARNTHRATQQRDALSSESAMAFRMTLLVATDAACWIPIIILGVWSLAGFTVPSQVFAWVAVFVLPLNAAINPVLYTLSTAPFMNPTRRNIKTLKKSFSRSHRRSYTSSAALSYNNHTVTECGADEICSIAPHVPFGRWLRKVDTVVAEHGETVPLRRTRTITSKGEEAAWKVRK